MESRGGPARRGARQTSSRCPFVLHDMALSPFLSSVLRSACLTDCLQFGQTRCKQTTDRTSPFFHSRTSIFKSLGHPHTPTLVPIFLPHKYPWRRVRCSLTAYNDASYGHMDMPRVRPPDEGRNLRGRPFRPLMRAPWRRPRRRLANKNRLRVI